MNRKNLICVSHYFTTFLTVLVFGASLGGIILYFYGSLKLFDLSFDDAQRDSLALVLRLFVSCEGYADGQSTMGLNPQDYNDYLNVLLTSCYELKAPMYMLISVTTALFFLTITLAFYVRVKKSAPDTTFLSSIVGGENASPSLSRRERERERDRQTVSSVEEDGIGMAVAAAPTILLQDNDNMDLNEQLLMSPRGAASCCFCDVQSSSSSGSAVQGWRACGGAPFQSSPFFILSAYFSAIFICFVIASVAYILSVTCVFTSMFVDCTGLSQEVISRIAQPLRCIAGPGMDPNRTAQQFLLMIKYVWIGCILLTISIFYLFLQYFIVQRCYERQVKAQKLKSEQEVYKNHRQLPSHAANRSHPSHLQSSSSVSASGPVSYSLSHSSNRGPVYLSQPSINNPVSTASSYIYRDNSREVEEINGAGVLLQASGDNTINGNGILDATSLNVQQNSFLSHSHIPSLPNPPQSIRGIAESSQQPLL